MNQGLDFKLFLDAVIQAGARTRNGIFATVLFCTAILAVYLNTGPMETMYHRYEGMDQAYRIAREKGQVSYLGHQINPMLFIDTASAIASETYALNHLAQALDSVFDDMNKLYSETESLITLIGALKENHWPLPDEKDADEIYREARNSFIRKRVDSRVVILPFAGSVDIDNILWISLPTFLIMAFILRASMEREVDAIKNAVARAARFLSAANASEDADTRKLLEVAYTDAITLLKNIQVLSSPQPDNRWNRWMILPIIFAPFFITGLLFIDDTLKHSTGDLLHGRIFMDVSRLIQTLLLINLFLLSFLNAVAWLELIWALDDEQGPRCLLQAIRGLKQWAKDRLNQFQKQSTEPDGGLIGQQKPMFSPPNNYTTASNEATEEVTLPSPSKR